MAMEAAANEAELMWTCGHLYASIALESFSTTLLALVFSYLLLLITNKGRLSNPGHAAWAFLVTNVKTFYREVRDEVSHWHEMPGLPLERRFALCRKVNQAVCLFQIIIAVLTIERWLHINNINGFRYLGYSMTCPPMQTQLLILIAPAVPCYRLSCCLTYFLTMVMLWLGYAASVIHGNLYDGDMSLFLETMNLDDLRPNLKFWFSFSAAIIQVFLSFVQIPYLYGLYLCKGGMKGGLPRGYGKLLLNVSASWLAFPVWWLLSFEGMSIITDTKANAAGFALLNVISKGSFTLQMLSMVQWHRNEKMRREAAEKGQQNADGKVGLFDPAAEEVLPEVEKKETWVVKVLRPYDHITGAGHELWASLEPTYRAYLLGCGINTDKWAKMSNQERLDKRADYESTFEQILGERAEAVQEQAEKVVGEGPKTAPEVNDPSPVHGSRRHDQI